MIETKVFNSRVRSFNPDALRRASKDYLKTLKKKELRSLIHNIMDNYFDPMGYDASVQFRKAISEEDETGFYCLHSGEKIG